MYLYFISGLTIFRGIQALDRDKPNTANSEISYEITSGNNDKKFSIEGMEKCSFTCDRNVKLKTPGNIKTVSA